eukprot:1361303-Amorphochlora_amoeboformis.AAC.1
MNGMRERRGEGKKGKEGDDRREMRKRERTGERRGGERRGVIGSCFIAWRRRRSEALASSSIRRLRRLAVRFERRNLKAEPRDT